MDISTIPIPSGRNALIARGQSARSQEFWPQRLPPTTASSSSSHSTSQTNEGMASISRRKAWLSGLASLPLFLTTKLAKADPSRSLNSEKAATVTFANQTQHKIKIYWNNYDADKEFFAMLSPDAQYTIDTFASHPWTVVDADSDKVMEEYVATEGFHLVSIKDGSEEASTQSQPKAAVLDERLSMGGFDGLGSAEDAYAPAQLFQVGIDMDSGLAALKVEGFDQPLGLFIGLPEAAALLYASGVESRRPSTLRTWQQSLNAVDARVERVLLTRLVGHTYYARIVLNQNGKTMSLDARPSDSLALALQTKSPVFVAKEVASANDRAIASGLPSPTKKLPKPGPVENILGPGYADL